MCLCVKKRERVCVHIYKRGREKENICERDNVCVCAFVCVCVCVRERERELISSRLKSNGRERNILCTVVVENK